VIVARRALQRHRTEVVLGLGGFVSVPAVLAAKSLGIPAAILEINAVPGRATRALAPLCARVFHAWRGSVPARAAERDRLVGPPLSQVFASGVRVAGDPLERRAARQALGFDPERPLLVVLGGSQGAGALNAFVRGAQTAFLDAGLAVLHQVGPGRLAEAGAEREGYRALEYMDDVSRPLRAAELVLCRGGASTLAEIAALEVPACVVPYPHHADRHQERNAAELAGGVLVIEERALGEAGLERILTLASRAAEPERERMRACLRERLPRDGARRIYVELEDIACTLRWKRRAGFRGMAP
jgi:UDP-N-acetylglucosamine--N-acetylmuramyl-(pentapeptide) pyrophosphoryl-undecaprenol N-acetylglucosamine transferase